MAGILLAATLLITALPGMAWADAAAPWRACVNPLNYGAGDAPANELRVFDRFGRDISLSGLPLMDWEGFVENPQFRMSIEPPAGVAYPVTLRVTAPGAPRIFIFKRHLGEDPYDIRNTNSVHNETGPFWGVELYTLNDDTFVAGGVSHELTDAELTEIGLRRQVFTFWPDSFPLELHVGIHPDRAAGNERYELDIEMTDANNTVYRRSLPVHVCDQDRPNRNVAFKFHVDYSYDFDGYLENTEDGKVVAASAEQTLNDLAYFFADMRFDEVPRGACSTTVNWTQPVWPADGSNTRAYSRGHYVFITSHSGGGGLNSDYMHRINGQETDFSACSFWGANPRDVLSVNVSNRIYVPEDDWWRVVSWNYGENGQCLGDALDDPGNGCIECPNDAPWCAHQRGDLFWPNLHELNHGLTMATGWPRWGEWFWSEELCVEDDELTLFAGTCLPMYRTDHIVLFGETFEANKQADWGRTLFRKYDFLLMRAVGWELRDTTMMQALAFFTESLDGGQLGSRYDDRVEAFGGIPSYRFMVVDGTLPPGVSLNSFNGRLQGTPTAAGTYRFTLRLDDSDEYSVLRQGGIERSFEVTIDG
ncbi:MAG: Ig domain-containing protein [Pseudomonadota bacterium]